MYQKKIRLEDISDFEVAIDTAINKISGKFNPVNDTLDIFICTNGSYTGLRKHVDCIIFLGLDPASLQSPMGAWKYEDVIADGGNLSNLANSMEKVLDLLEERNIGASTDEPEISIHMHYQPDTPSKEAILRVYIGAEESQLLLTQ